MKYKIYKLINLDTREIIYIGITKNSLGRRRSGHISFMKSFGIENFGIKLIEETDDNSKERYWIQYYKDLGFNLLNKLNGNGLDKNEYNKEYRKGYYQENKEYYKGYNKEYYDNNKDYLIKNIKENKEKNKEKQKEYYEEYYLNNKEKIDNANKEYQEKNKEKLKEYRKKYYKEYRERNKNKI